MLDHVLVVGTDSVASLESLAPLEEALVSVSPPSLESGVTASLVDPVLLPPLPRRRFTTSTANSCEWVPASASVSSVPVPVDPERAAEDALLRVDGSSSV